MLERVTETTAGPKAVGNEAIDGEASAEPGIASPDDDPEPPPPEGREPEPSRAQPLIAAGAILVVGAVLLPLMWRLGAGTAAPARSVDVDAEAAAAERTARLREGARLLRDAVSAQGAGDLDAAAAALSRVVDEHDDPDTVARALARLDEVERERRARRERLEAVARRQALAMERSAAGRPDEAVTILEAIDPSTIGAAAATEITGALAEARSAARERAARAADAFEEARGAEATGDRDEARRRYETVVVTFDGLPHAQLALEALRALGEHRARQPAATEAVAPVADADELAALADALARAGEHDRAIEELGRALEARPGDTTLTAKLDAVVASRRRADEARERSDQARRFYEDGVRALAARDLVSAETTLAEALRLEPDLDEARVKLGLARYHREIERATAAAERGDREATRAALVRAIDAGPDADPECAREWLGRLEAADEAAMLAETAAAAPVVADGTPAAESDAVEVGASGSEVLSVAAESSGDAEAETPTDAEAAPARSEGDAGPQAGPAAEPEAAADAAPEARTDADPDAAAKELQLFLSVQVISLGARHRERALALGAELRELGFDAFLVTRGRIVSICVGRIAPSSPADAAALRTRLRGTKLAGGVGFPDCFTVQLHAQLAVDLDDVR